MTRAVFFGTPAYALPVLGALVESAEVALVVTRPDRPRGRSGRPRPSPVKKAAERLEIPVCQPARLHELRDRLVEIGPDVGVVVAFGSIIPREVMSAVPGGLLNVHFSLLPRWRGAAPVERSILSGDERTGVSLMVIDEGIDTGPVLATAQTPIFPLETAGELTDRLARMGAALLRLSLPRYLQGELEPRPQDESMVTYAEKVTVEEARLRPEMEADGLLRAIRAFNPRPGAWAVVDGRRLKVWRARPSSPVAGELPAGRIELRGDRLLLGAADGELELEEVQPEGKRRMSGESWGRGLQGEARHLR